MRQELDQTRYVDEEPVRIEPDRLAAALAQARELGGVHDEPRALELIVRGAVASVEGADRGGVTLSRRDGTITSQAPTDPAVAEIDQLQATLRQGPCVDAIWDEPVVRVADMTEETERWPQFAPQAVENGILSTLSLRLFYDGTVLGALNLHADEPHAFTPASFTVAELFSTHATIALSAAQHAAQLDRALHSRDLIGQAKGILMERFDTDADGAFAILVNASQDTNMKLIDVAQWVTGNRSALR